MRFVAMLDLSFLCGAALMAVVAGRYVQRGNPPQTTVLDRYSGSVWACDFENCRLLLPKKENQ